MKRIALLMMAGVIVASPAAAATKKKKAPKAPPAAAQKVDTRNEDSWRLVRDSLPVWLPTWSLPIYMKIKESQEPPPAAQKTRSAKKKS